MQTSFASLSFPAQAARRLSSLLPALSIGVAQDWTAQVYGYKDWLDLRAAVGTPAASRQEHLDEREARRVKARKNRLYEERVAGRSSPQLGKLCELMGWPLEAAENLFSIWAPSFSGQPARQYLANLGQGTPAFNLLQQSVFPLEREEGILGEYDDILVYEGFPLSAEEHRRAATKFVAKLPKKLRDTEGSALVEDLCQAHAHCPVIVKTSNEGEFKQVREFLFFAFRDNAERDLIGFASVTFSLIAGRDGTHSANIRINRLLSAEKDYEIAFALSDGISTELWRPVSRYLWCAVGNPVKDTRVEVAHPKRHRAEKAAAEVVSELIAAWCGWPNTNNRPERYGIHFNVAPQL